MAKTKVVRGPKGAGGAKDLPATDPPAPAAVNSGGGITGFNYMQPGDSIGAPYDSLLQAADIVRSGLPVAAVARLQETSGLTMERIKLVARISEGSFARRKKTGRLSQEESERLLRMSHVFELATALHDGDQAGARQWLEMPIPSLGNQRPLDLARTGPGAREVEDLIGRIVHGVLS